MTEDSAEPLYVSTIRRRRQRKPPELIRESQAVHRLIQPLVRGVDREHFYVLYLTTKHAVIEIGLVSVGSLNASIVHPREVFKRAIELSAASIIAKEHRDRLMRSYDAMHPGYGWASNKGYGSAGHLEALRRLGPTPLHRRSFAPVAQLELL